MFVLFFFEGTRPAASMRPPCLLYLSASVVGLIAGPRLYYQNINTNTTVLAKRGKGFWLLHTHDILTVKSDTGKHVSQDMHVSGEFDAMERDPPLQVFHRCSHSFGVKVGLKLRTNTFSRKTTAVLRALAIFSALCTADTAGTRSSPMFVTVDTPGTWQVFRGSILWALQPLVVFCPLVLP